MKDMEKDLLKDVVDKANELLEQRGCGTLRAYEALSIAAQIQANELYSRANVLDTPNSAPPALEQIAIELHGITAQIPYIGQ